MKVFACGDVVPGCTMKFRAEREEEVLTAVAAHAAKDHGLTVLPDSLIAQVRSLIRTDAAA